MTGARDGWVKLWPLLKASLIAELGKREAADRLALAAAQLLLEAAAEEAVARDNKVVPLRSRPDSVTG